MSKPPKGGPGSGPRPSGGTNVGPSRPYRSGVPFSVLFPHGRNPDGTPKPRPPSAKPKPKR